MGEVVRYDVEGGVAVVTIDRPERKNAMSVAVFDQLHERAEQAAADDRVGAVLVRGAGGNLSSGLDLSVFEEQAEGGIDESFIVRLQSSFNAFEDIDKPTVAFVEGYCFGGGIQLALACHLRLIAPTAQISVMETRWAIVPDLGGTQRLARLVGAGRALELCATARRVGAQEALAIGLGEVAVDSYEDALAYAQRLATGPGAVRRLPRLVRENIGVTRDQAQANERRTQIACLTGPDFQEAVVAFLEQRDPTFVGE